MVCPPVAERVHSSHDDRIKNGPPAWRLGVGLTITNHKKLARSDMSQRASDLDSVGQPKQGKKDIKFGT